MTYPTVDAGKSRPRHDTPDPVPGAPTRHERLRAGLVLAGLLSLAAVFWIAVIRLVAMT